MTLDVKLRKPIEIYEDNSGAINIVIHGNYTKNSKHIAVHYHYVYEFIKQGIIKVTKVDTNNNIADIFTKSLCKKMCEKFRGMMGLN